MEDQATYKTARVNAADVVPGRVFMEMGHKIQILARFPLRGTDWVCFAMVGMAIPTTLPLHELLARLSPPASMPDGYPLPYSGPTDTTITTWFAPRIGADLTR